MPRLRHTVEQLLAKLREAEVALSKARPSFRVSRSLGITERALSRSHGGPSHALGLLEWLCCHPLPSYPRVSLERFKKSATAHGDPCNSRGETGGGSSISSDSCEALQQGDRIFFNTSATDDTWDSPHSGDDNVSPVKMPVHGNASPPGRHDDPGVPMYPARPGAFSRVAHE